MAAQPRRAGAARVWPLGSANAALLRSLDVVTSLRADSRAQADAMERFLSDWRAGRLARIAWHQELIERAEKLGRWLPPEHRQRLVEAGERSQAAFDGEKRLVHRYTQMLNALREASRAAPPQPQQHEAAD